MIDIATQIGAIDRTVLRQTGEDGTENVVVVARRVYDAETADVWDALTDPERIVRWFLPISGELREGGSFQLEGNASGDILECRPPSSLRVTFGSEVSIVDLRLEPADGDRTLLELTHTVPLAIAQSGAGALWAGPGWDGGFMALGLLLAGELTQSPVDVANSPEGLAFSERSVRAWAAAVETSGTASSEELAQAVEISLAQFAPGAENGHPQG